MYKYFLIVSAPPITWIDACNYLAAIYNRTSNEALGWETPISKRHAYTIFSFFEKVYYLDPMSTFPDSEQKTGRFLGVSENTGDTLTFIVWDEGTETKLIRSVVQSVKPSNKRVKFDPSIQTAIYNSSVPHDEQAGISPSENTSPIPIPIPHEQSQLQFGSTKFKIDKTLSRVDIRRQKRALRKLQKRTNKHKQQHPTPTAESTPPIPPQDVSLNTPRDHSNNHASLPISDPTSHDKPPSRRSQRQRKPRVNLMQNVRQLLLTMFPSSHLFASHAIPHEPHDAILDAHLLSTREQLLGPAYSPSIYIYDQLPPTPEKYAQIVRCHSLHTIPSSSQTKYRHDSRGVDDHDSRGVNNIQDQRGVDQTRIPQTIHEWYEHQMYLWQFDMANASIVDDEDDKMWAVKRITEHRRIKHP